MVMPLLARLPRYLLQLFTCLVMGSVLSSALLWWGWIVSAGYVHLWGFTPSIQWYQQHVGSHFIVLVVVVTLMVMGIRALIVHLTAGGTEVVTLRETIPTSTHLNRRHP